MEEYVLIDDFSGGIGTYYPKIWGDEYPIDGETKGCRANLAYRVIFITSNYKIDELFHDTPVDIPPIVRRWKYFHLPSADQDDRDQLLGDLTEYI